MLKIGQKIRCELSKETLTVMKKLGEGGQGIVYLVQGKSGQKAVKWYNLNQATNEQKANISELIMQGPPGGIAGKRFIWPIDIVTSAKMRQFGYLMDVIDTSKYSELGEIFAHLKPVPTFFAKCKISENLVNSYRQLHLDGRCYRDISAGNLMFNVKTGEVLICDNDNIGVENHSTSQVNGTMEYMAPEIIKGKAKPSSKTDLYSLSVLLFYLWIWHHPLHGILEYNIRSWDLPAKRKIYGENPIFIFDPLNKSNSLPSDAEYNTPRRFWQLCPEPLKKLFTKAFTRGLINPNERVTEGEWQSTFVELGDCIVPCPCDNAENFWHENIRELRCWYCGNKIEVPVRLRISTPSGKKNLILNRTTKLYERHINPYADESIRNNVIGELIKNPNNPDAWGLKNLSKNIWRMQMTDNSFKEVKAGKAAQLSSGVTLIFNAKAKGVFEK